MAVNYRLTRSPLLPTVPESTELTDAPARIIQFFKSLLWVLKDTRECTFDDLAALNSYLDKTPLFPTYQNLSITQLSTSTCIVTIDRVAVVNEGGSGLVLSNLSKTIDIASSGVNGLDTGSEAISTWYHIWAIAKSDGTLDCLFSTSYTSPVMPAGYEYKCYLGAVYNNAYGNFALSIQKDNKVLWHDTPLILNAGTAASWTAIDLSTVMPPNAKVFCGQFQAMSGTSGTSYWCYALDSVGAYPRYCYIETRMTSPSMVVSDEVVLLEPQTIYYIAYTASGYGNAYVYATGYEL